MWLSFLRPRDRFSLAELRRLLAFPKGNNSDYFSLYLDVVDFVSLPCRWRRIVNFRLAIVNHLSKKFSILKETEHCFDGKSTKWGFPAMLPLSKLHDKDGGFLLNGEVMIVAELDVLEVIGTLDASEKTEDASELVSQKKEIDCLESNDLLMKSSPLKETNNVNGTKQVR
ncbi:PREDICTED: MATH domain and coiled-coil domain-containing protein At3g58340-like [Camelina sativa]|uniref:MATH domain and coiled-coil domain-containing protein At3g58340-like n=1 Tax=Camelina sativa TaxID=90675 RepID=A0ABM0V7F7_CAMSA|nr:PREDICTED: MATH domain and coiled-coil domain-containing protein At3g58340-like [Camelina sativa]